MTLRRSVSQSSDKIGLNLIDLISHMLVYIVPIYVYGAYLYYRRRYSFACMQPSVKCVFAVCLPVVHLYHICVCSQTDNRCTYTYFPRKYRLELLCSSKRTKKGNEGEQSGHSTIIIIITIFSVCENCISFLFSLFFNNLRLVALALSSRCLNLRVVPRYVRTCLPACVQN